MLGSFIASAPKLAPSASVGLSAVNGSSIGYMSSDSAPIIDKTITPTWTGLHTFSAAVVISGAFTQASGAVTVTGGASTLTTSSGALTMDAATAFNIGATNATAVNLATSSTVTSLVGQPILENGTTAGGAGVTQRIITTLSSVADNTPTNLVVITVPNQTGGAGFKVTIGGVLGAGTGAQEKKYTVSISRIAGAASKINIGTAAVTATVGSVTCTVTLTNVAVSGANNATQTFQLQVTVARGSGASTNHWAMSEIECLNPIASGVTVA